MKKPTIVIGSDHAGFGLKEYLRELLEELDYPVEDLGTDSRDSVDYPDYAEKVGRAVAGSRNRKGILSCGTGVGISIAANKIPGVRAALVQDPRTARLAVEHNNANILVLPGRPFSRKKIAPIVKAWLESEFAGGRHGRRVGKITRLEKKYRP
ncbi:MAG: ribose 5-phosphate isomerase B [Candidatus Erginobacter occultus]|nr:ribose 5-phosphate isomerase B [Candidatus Erginobacter occultus]